MYRFPIYASTSITCFSGSIPYAGPRNNAESAVTAGSANHQSPLTSHLSLKEYAFPDAGLKQASHQSRL